MNICLVLIAFSKQPFLNTFRERDDGIVKETVENFR